MKAPLPRFLSGIEAPEAELRDADADRHEHRADDRCHDRVPEEQLVNASISADARPERSVAESRDQQADRDQADDQSGQEWAQRHPGTLARRKATVGTKVAPGRWRSRAAAILALSLLIVAIAPSGERPSQRCLEQHLPGPAARAGWPLRPLPARPLHPQPALLGGLGLADRRRRRLRACCR
jgi:hypothetical protein